MLRHPLFPADDAAGILPVVRDNGKQQGIVLVNTGQPGDIGWDKVGPGPAYQEIRATRPVVANYKLSLKALQQPAGTRYVDPESGERFVVNARGELVSAENPEKGLDVAIYRVLMREE